MISRYIGLGVTKQLWIAVLFTNQCILKSVIYKDKQIFFFNKMPQGNLKNNVQDTDPATTFSR